MRLLVLVSTAWAAAHAATVHFDYAPKSVYLPESVPATARLSDMPTIIGNLLGLTAERPAWWNGKGDALSRPEAALVFDVQTKDGRALTTEHEMYTYSMADEQASMDMYDVAMRVSNAADTNTVVTLNSEDALAVRGPDDIARRLADIDAGDAPTTGVPLVDAELAQMHRLHAFLSGESGRHGGAPDLYTVHVRSLADVADPAVKAVVRDMMQTLIADVRARYGDNVVALSVYSSVPQMHFDGDNTIDAVHMRSKRAVDDKMPDIESIKFSSPHYPAMFAIILFTGLFLFATLLFLAHGMWTLEPDKDTIIYRMTRSKNKDM